MSKENKKKGNGEWIIREESSVKRIYWTIT